MASKSVTVYIPEIVMDDYRRRGVFTELPAAKTAPQYAPPRGCSQYVIPLKTAYRMYDDAMDRRVHRSSEVDTRLFRGYGHLKRFIREPAGILEMNSLAWAPEHPVMARLWKRAEATVLRDLFYPLGINAAGTTE